MTFALQNFTALPSRYEEFTKKIIHTTLREEEVDGNIYIDAAFVGEERMRQLNKRIRAKNYATDVLSFAGETDTAMPQDSGKYLGEVVVCPEVIKRQAAKSGKSFRWEFTHVIIHGTLHLLGWRHEHSEKAAEKMHAREEEIIKLVL